MFGAMKFDGLHSTEKSRNGIMSESKIKHAVSFKLN